MSRIVSTKLVAVHRPTTAPSQQQRPGANGEHFLDRLAKRRRDVRRESAKDVGDGQHRVLALPEQVRDGGSDDEEREQRDDRQVGEIAGVDEPVVVDADRDALTTSHAVTRGFSFSSTSVPNAARIVARRLRRSSGESGEWSLIGARG